MYHCDTIKRQLSCMIHFYRDSHSLPSLFTKSCVTIKTFYDNDSMYNLAMKCQSVIYAKYENVILGNIEKDIFHANDRSQPFNLRELLRGFFACIIFIINIIFIIYLKTCTKAVFLYNLIFEWLDSI